MKPHYKLMLKERSFKYSKKTAKNDLWQEEYFRKYSLYEKEEIQIDWTDCGK